MKKIIFFFLTLILSACSPQVTVTSAPTECCAKVTVTLAPPTETPIPTPTLHPDFIAWRELISASGRYTLTPDGLIQGDGVVINGLHIDSNGILTLTVNNEKIILTTSDITFAEDGIKTKDYELDENGQWVEAISEAIQTAQADFAKYGYSTEGLTFKENGDSVWAVDSESRDMAYENGKFFLEYAVAQAGQLDLMPTDIEPDKTVLEGAGLYTPESRTVAAEYFVPLFKRVSAQFFEEYGIDIYHDKSTGQRVMLNPKINAWGSNMTYDDGNPKADRYLYYELADGTIHIVPLYVPGQ
jgi:hypothetical protein